MSSTGLDGVLNLDLIGGSLCIDFANTVHDYEVADPRDELGTYGELVLWAERAGAVGDGLAKRLAALAAAHPRKAASCLESGKAMRRLVYDVFSRIARGDKPRRKDIKRLNAALVEVMRHARLTAIDRTFELGWEDKLSLERVLWPIVRSAVDLLTSPRLPQLKACQGDNCTWLFLDKSKNRRRRWCEMEVCGNRAKSRRHYERTRRATRWGGPGRS